MSTRSFIHVHRADGLWARIYCHFDGYYEGVGQKLLNHYNSQELAEALVSLGDISSIGEIIGEKHDFDFGSTLYQKHNHDFRKRDADPEYIRLKTMCNAYGRDRGEKDVDTVVGPTLEEVFESEEYMYVWRDGQWWAMSYSDDLSDLRLLADIMAEDAEKEDAA